MWTCHPWVDSKSGVQALWSACLWLPQTPASAWQGASLGWAMAQHSASAEACAGATGWLERERAWLQQAALSSQPAPEQPYKAHAHRVHELYTHTVHNAHTEGDLLCMH